MSFTESESLVLRYLDIKPSQLKSKNVDYWINEQGLTWHHLEILDHIKHGNIKKLKKKNDVGKYIDFYIDKMLKVAIENEQIDMIEYLSVSKQINKNINNYLNNVTPAFFEKLMERFGCYNNAETKYNSVPVIDIDYLLSGKDISKDYLYNYYRNLCVIEPQEVYNRLKYNKYRHVTRNDDNCKYNKELERYLEEKYNCLYEFNIDDVDSETCVEASYVYLQSNELDKLILVVKKLMKKKCKERYFTDEDLDRMKQIFKLFNQDIYKIFNENDIDINSIVNIVHEKCANYCKVYPPKSIINKI
jgi:hypothetical protein